MSPKKKVYCESEKSPLGSSLVSLIMALTGGFCLSIHVVTDSLAFSSILEIEERQVEEEKGKKKKTMKKK